MLPRWLCSKTRRDTPLHEHRSTFQTCASRFACVSDPNFRRCLASFAMRNTSRWACTMRTPRNACSEPVLPFHTAWQGQAVLHDFVNSARSCSVARRRSKSKLPKSSACVAHALPC